MPLNPIKNGGQASLDSAGNVLVNVSGQKQTFTETTGLLAANGTYTGPWHDSELTGSVYAIVTSLSNVAGAVSGFQIQLSEDINNASLTYTSEAGALSPPANTRIVYPVYLRTRYWRIVYTNGVTTQASFEITYTLFSNWMGSFPTQLSATAAVGALPVQAVNTAGLGTGDNDTLSGTTFIPTSGSTGGALSNTRLYGGAFSGTADIVRQGWSKSRTPTVFKQVSTQATSTAVWTPASGNRFRLMQFKIQVTGNATTTGGAEITIKLLDSATDLGLGHIVFVPSAITSPTINDYDSGWIDLGAFGALSAVANNVLNVTLSAALTAGHVNVVVAGVEE